jgi:DNA ligase-1
MFRPMLAPREDPLSYPNFFKELPYPLMLSPKYDGIRSVVKGGYAMSRTSKMLPSEQVQNDFTYLEHADGELIDGRPTDFGVYNRTQSVVMSRGKLGNLSYHIFDFTSPDIVLLPFYQRVDYLMSLDGHLPFGHYIVEHTIVDNEDELLEYEEKQLLLGYEGIMMRHPEGIYKGHDGKANRATWLDMLIFKLKRFEDAEANIFDVYEGQTNNNVKTYDAQGFATRTTHQENQVPSGMAGGYVVKFEGQYLDVAPGSFTHDQRKVHLANPKSVIGEPLKFRFMRHGSKDKPRFPRALGLRSQLELEV